MAPQTVVWAIDPFEEIGQLRESQLQAVRILASHAGTRVIPLYLFSPYELNLSVEFAPLVATQYEPAAARALEDIVAKLGVPTIEKPRLVSHESSSRSKAVDHLIREAHHLRADMILVGTHGRKGVERWLLGSFAETLLFRSDIPTLVVTVVPLQRRGFGKILFPTDLGEHSRALFRDAVHTAKDWGAELVLFHSLPNPVEPILQSGVFLLGGAWAPVHPYFSEDAIQRRKKVEAWAEWAHDQGVKITAHVEERGGPVAGSILHACRQAQVDLIMIAAQSNRIESLLIGSISRQVVRQSSVPVMILHPHPRKQFSESAA